MIPGWSPPEGPALVVEGLSVSFGARQVVRGITESVSTGEWLAVIGANGAGKTTLLRAICQLEAHAGSVTVRGEDLSLLGPRPRARLVAYLPQSPELPDEMSVLDYVLLGRNPHIGYFAMESAADRELCYELLARLDLAHISLRALRTLSGGERHRVLLCRALAQQAAVLLLDEPTSDLDLYRRVEVLELVDELRHERDVTVLTAMHDLSLAAQFADRLLLISDGAAVVSGPPREVLVEETLSRFYGGSARVVTTDDGEIIVAPRRRLR